VKVKPLTADRSRLALFQGQCSRRRHAVILQGRGVVPPPAPSLVPTISIVRCAKTRLSQGSQGHIAVDIQLTDGGQSGATRIAGATVPPTVALLSTDRSLDLRGDVVCR